MSEEKKIAQLISESGTVSLDPDWTNTFVLPPDDFAVVWNFGPSIRGEANGYRYVKLGKYRIREDEPTGSFLDALFAEKKAIALGK